MMFVEATLTPGIAGVHNGHLKVTQVSSVFPRGSP